MNPILDEHVVARLRRPPSSEHVVPGSTPVLSFGNASDAVVATLGLNPSRQEFLDQNGRELSGKARRFETLASLGVTSLNSASEAMLRRVVHACNGYFQANPYRRWFDQLEPVLQSVGASYYDGSACHLDIVQWATDPVWSKIPDRAVRGQLLEEDSAFLLHQLRAGSFNLLLINGSGVIRQFEAMTGISLQPVGSVHGSSAEALISVGSLPLGPQVIAWSVNVQSSFGVCNALRAALASRVGQLHRDGAIGATQSSQPSRPMGSTQPNPESSRDRMPPVPLNKMTPLQRKFAEVIINGPRGGLYGPFIPLLRSPELMDSAQRMGEYLRYKSAIGNALSEFVILIVSRRWTQQVEWAIHEPIAIKAGIKPEVVKAIRDGRRPVGMTGDEELVYDFCAELQANQSVSDATYQRAVTRFGEQGVIDMVGVCGYYTFLAMIMNTARTPVAAPAPGAGAVEPLRAFPK